MAKNQFLNWENYHKFNFTKKIDLFDITSFFAWTFLNFLAHCALGIDYKFINLWMNFHEFVKYKLYWRRKRNKQRFMTTWNKFPRGQKLLAKFHFLQFQKWPKINFWIGKKFETAKNAISRKKMIYLISRVFCLNFFKFSGPLWYTNVEIYLWLLFL